ncbi:MAG: type III-B CRISPR module-associated Cmr3 family protein, partial [Chloroflexota bacterium]
ATRRMSPAGSVYFLELNGSEANISSFIEAVWMQNISDDEQDCRDGFGLAVLGTWDGNIPEIDLSNQEVAYD